VRISRSAFQGSLQRVSSAVGTHAKGRALEDFICYFFPLVPGVKVVTRNALNTFRTEEVDVALWNEKHKYGFYFLPHLLLVECKNWSQPCGSQEVSYFVSRLQQRGCDHGILLAAAGITGAAEDLTRAHFEIATALARNIRVIVLTTADIAGVHDTQEIVDLMKQKLCQLTVSGTTFL
jgi:hypothetical protein